MVEGKGEGTGRFFRKHPRVRQGLFLGLMVAGMGASLIFLLEIGCACQPVSRLIWTAIAAVLLWLVSGFFLSGILRWLYLGLPLVLPVVGSVLVTMGVLFALFVRRKDYLSDDPTLQMIFHLEEKTGRFAAITLDEVLEHDRKIVSASDILRWGEISIKQAVIDRLATGETTPRAIRILKGAWNDPDEEVRLFATTILTRLEKGYQERIKALTVNPDQERPNAELGKLYLAYANSNLVGQKLARILIASGLTAYRKAIVLGEPLGAEELSRIGSAAIALGESDLRDLVMDHPGIGSDSFERRRLEWMALYEEGRWTELRDEVLGARSAMPAGGAWPDYLEVWAGDPLLPGRSG